MAEALQQIRGGADIDAVAFDSGYESPSGFRDAFLKTFRQPPGRSRDADCLGDQLRHPGPVDQRDEHDVGEGIGQA